MGYMRVLENKGSVEVLKYLLVKGEAMLTEIGDELRKYNLGTGSLYNVLKSFLENGIIVEDRRYRVRLFSLTGKGRRLAEAIIRLEEELSKDP